MVESSFHMVSLDPEEYAHMGTFLNSEGTESNQVVGFRVPVLALFDEQANMDAHERLFSAS